MKKVTHIRFEVICLKPDILIDKPFPSVGEVFGNLENREVNRFEYLTLYLSTSSYSK